MSKPTLDELISKYLAAIDAGEAQERERLMTDHPEHADGLRKFYADFDRMRGVVERAEGEATCEFVADEQQVGCRPPSKTEGTLLSKLSDETQQRLARLLHKLKENHAKDTGLGETATSSAKSEASRVIDGKYKLLQQIGSGGMGEVWMAEQEKPVSRRVALKLIKTGMDTKEVVARFEAERQALAMMDHQHIAKVLDGGSTEQGRPYFVMELVQGIPITNYCDKNKLSINERLNLFIPVCNAVQHAHHKGIIHRDLKPSNILVTLYDGRPVAKVIDFGLAKALQHQARLTDKTLFTEFGQVVGTLQYMSPEQAEMNALDVDTRTDIYSLGVILYELLTGSTPIDRNTLDKQAIYKVLETIRETDPPRPSIRLSSSGDAITGISQQRQIEPKKLTQMLRGDLDWIVMKALEKDRRRRYETANALSEDLALFCDGDAVSARPPSLPYRTAKLVRRNVGFFIAVAAFFLLICAGLVVSTIALRQTQIAKEDALAAAESAKREQEKASTINAFFNELLANASPYKSPHPEITLAEVLNSVSENLDRDFSAHPDVEASIRHTLASTYLGLGSYMDAEQHSLRATALRSEHFSPTHPLTLVSQLQYVRVLRNQGRLLEAYEAIERLVHQGREVLGREDLTYHECMLEQVSVYDDLGRSIEALELAQNVIESAQRLSWDDVGLLHRARHSLADIYFDLNRFEESEIELSYLLRQSQSDSVRLHSLRHSLAVLYKSSGREGEAMELFESVFEFRQARFGIEHPSTLSCAISLAGSHSSHGRFRQAESVYEETLEKLIQRLGPAHPQTLRCRKSMGTMFRQKGDYARAASITSQSLEVSLRVYGELHPHTLSAREGFAIVKNKSGEYIEAEELLTKNIAIRTRLYGKNHHDVLQSKLNLASVFRATGRLESAEALVLESLRGFEATAGAFYKGTLTCQNLLGIIYKDSKRYRNAEEVLTKVLDTNRKNLGADHPTTLANEFNVAELFRESGEFEKAAVIFAESLTRSERVLGAEHPGTLHFLNGLAAVSKSLGQYEKAEHLFLKTLELRTSILGVEHVDTLVTQYRLAGLYRVQGKLEQAVVEYEESYEALYRNYGKTHPGTIACRRGLERTYMLLGRDLSPDDLFSSGDTSK